jgi:hypothetical protein
MLNLFNNLFSMPNQLSCRSVAKLNPDRAIVESSVKRGNAAEWLSGFDRALIEEGRGPGQQSQVLMSKTTTEAAVGR